MLSISHAGVCAALGENKQQHFFSLCTLYCKNKWTSKLHTKNEQCHYNKTESCYLFSGKWKAPIILDYSFKSDMPSCWNVADSVHGSRDRNSTITPKSAQVTGHFRIICQDPCLWSFLCWKTLWNVLLLMEKNTPRLFTPYRV